MIHEEKKWEECLSSWTCSESTAEKTKHIIVLLDGIVKYVLDNHSYYNVPTKSKDGKLINKIHFIALPNENLTKQFKYGFLMKGTQMPISTKFIS